MKKQTLIVILVLLILVSGIGVASAETLTGTLGSSGWVSYNFESTGTWGYGGSLKFTVVNIELTSNAKTLVHFDNLSHLCSFDSGAPHGVTTPFNMTLGTQVVATGLMGYQRLFNTAWPTPSEIAGYQYYSFDTWNITGLTGTVDLVVNYNHSALYNFTTTSVALSGLTGAPTSYAYIRSSTGMGGPIAGSWTWNQDLPFQNTWNATKPSGLSISGFILKTIDNNSFASRAFIFDGVTNQPITSQALVTTDNFYFNVPAQSIKIGVRDSNGIFYNTSQLFTVTTTITPTVTPTPLPTIPSGYVRTSIDIWDRSGNMIHGANIDIKDIEAATWTNSTHDADGMTYIDTLPYHHLDIYANYDIFANEFLPNSLLNVETGLGGYVYFLTLFPYESGISPGNVNLYVEVKDADNGHYIPYANVMIVLPNGTSYSGSTANAGSKIFLVPNNTIIKATGSAAGYLSGTEIANSGTGGTSTTMTINLHKQTVTVVPTSTIPPGGTTPAVTVDPRSAGQKDADMMGLIRDAGPTLINLAIVVTLISLLGLMTKGFWK